MKRPLAIALMLLVAYLQAGFLALHPLQISLARTHAASQIKNAPTNRLIRLAFHKTESICFKDEGKEIYLRGQMYDILRSKKKNDSLIFHCYHDVEESALMALFEEGMDVLFEKETNSESSKVSYEIKLEYLPTPRICLAQHQNYVGVPLTCCALYSTALSFPTPPPRFA